MEQAVTTRGKYWCYDTPLRILERKIEELDASDEDFKILNDMKTLLENHGARSLHLFPCPELPGYVGADMEELRKMKVSISID